MQLVKPPFFTSSNLERSLPPFPLSVRLFSSLSIFCFLFLTYTNTKIRIRFFFFSWYRFRSIILCLLDLPNLESTFFFVVYVIFFQMFYCAWMFWVMDLRVKICIIIIGFIFWTFLTQSPTLLLRKFVCIYIYNRNWINRIYFFLNTFYVPQIVRKWIVRALYLFASFIPTLFLACFIEWLKFLSENSPCQFQIIHGSFIYLLIHGFSLIVHDCISNNNNL